VTINVEVASAEAQLFNDTLSCDLVLPARFVAGADVARPGASEMLLRSVAMVEDSRTADDGEERAEGSVQLQRLEAKMDLALMLLGRLLHQAGSALPASPARWSHRGLRLDAEQAAGLSPGTTGVVQLQPAEWLPDHVELPAVVLAQTTLQNGSSRLWLQQLPASDALASAVDRHLFRLHRRQIADSRRNR